MHLRTSFRAFQKFWLQTRTAKKKIARNVETGNCQKKMQSKFRLVNAVDLNFPAVINESSSSNNNKAKKK